MVELPVRKKVQVKPKKGGNLFSFLLFAAFAALAVWAFLAPVTSQREVPISEVITAVEDGGVSKIQVEGTALTVTLNSGEVVTSRQESGANFLETLSQAGVDLEKIEDGVIIEEGFPWLSLLVNFLPTVLFIVLFFVLLRRARGGMSDILSFGQSRAKLFMREKKSRVNFDNAAGVDEAKQELREVVDFLKNPGKYRALGARIPKGVLLVGPAGTGKTLLARAVAGEAGVPFYSMSGSEFMEMLVGVGAARVRDLFATAKKTAPSIIFIDEIESIGRQRGVGFSGGGHEEREQTLNQILTEMDGFTPNDNVIVLAATNRPDLLDQALTRPGRFDRRIVLDFPDIEGRKGIFKIHMQGKPFAKGVNIDVLARRTVGFSGADIENMLNEAAILAAREGKKAIRMSDLDEAATKVKLGPEKRRLQSEEERKITAYHEGGHALVASQLPHMDPVHRVSIVSRGLALGYTEIPPTVDRYHHTKTQLLERITSLLGGRAAEDNKFRELTVGAASDIEQATKISRKMVTEFGMSDLGPISLEQGAKFWLAQQLGEPVGYSEKMAAKIDEEVEKIIDDCYRRAKDILKKNSKKLDKVAKALIKKETLDGEEFKRLIAA
jgi:cell division protease FtsH